MLTVELTDFDKLTPDEQSNASSNGSGKEYASYVRVTHNGATILLESDAMEPEDARFSRDLNWTLEAMRRCYRLGVADGQLKRD